MGPLFIPILLLSAMLPADSSHQTLRMLPGDSGRSGGYDGFSDEWLYCDSWRLSVETNNAGPWATVPALCRGFVQAYMKGDHYVSDLEVVAADAISFAKVVDRAGNGKDAWIFDVDETLLSNLPYYEDVGFGSEVFDEFAFDEWVDAAVAPALEASLNLYKELQVLGFTLVLLTGRSEAQRNATENNLLFAGYQGWERLILREASDMGKAAVVYKSEKRAQLEAQGFRIHGNSGDQWSDLIGLSMASRSFKLPNPMYFIK